MSPESAIYCWNPATGHADMLRWPTDRDSLGSYECTYGASIASFQALTIAEKLALLAIEAIKSVQKDGIDPASAMAALAKLEVGL